MTDNHTISLSSRSNASDHALPHVLPTSTPFDQLDSPSLAPTQPDATLDDDRSSSLSDLDADLDDASSQIPQDDNDNDNDNENENESEAETERLAETPKPFVRVHTANGLTPSKLKEETVYDDRDDSSDSQATPTARPRTTSELAGRKRKRPSPMSSRDSPLSDASDSDRTLSAKQRPAKPRLDASTKVSPAVAAQHINIEINGHGHADETDDDEATSPIKPDHGLERGRSRLRRVKEGEVPFTATESIDGADSAEDDNTRRNEPEDEDQEDEDDEDTALSAEEVERRSQAAQAFNEIAKQFLLWRIKSQSEKIAAAEVELTELSRPTPSHIDYIRQMQCITARRDLRMRQDTRLHQYKRQALRNETIAHRSQLLSQYYQEARDVRDRILYDLGKEWYDTQNDRRSAQADELNTFGYAYPSSASERIRQQQRYNTEVSVLAGIAKYVGFPAAPDINGARSNELEDDFKAMKVPLRQHLTLTKPVERMQAPVLKSDQLAQREFLEQTPWANPQHPVHRTPSAFGTYSLVANHHSIQPARRSSLPGHVSSPPFSTSAHMSGRPVPSSVIPAPRTTDRMHLDRSAARAGDGSPMAPVSRKRLIEPDEGGKRNVSGLSSTSTIEAAPSSDPASNGIYETALVGQPQYGGKGTLDFSSSSTFRTPRNHSDDTVRPTYATHGLRLSGVGGDQEMAGT